MCRQATHAAEPKFWVSWWTAWRCDTVRQATRIGFSNLLLSWFFRVVDDDDESCMSLGLGFMWELGNWEKNRRDSVDDQWDVYEINIKLNKHDFGVMLNIKILSERVLEIGTRGFRARAGAGKSGIFP